MKKLTTSPLKHLNGDRVQRLADLLGTKEDWDGKGAKQMAPFTWLTFLAVIKLNKDATLDDAGLYLLTDGAFVIEYPAPWSYTLEFKESMITLFENNEDEGKPLTIREAARKLV